MEVILRLIYDREVRVEMQVFMWNLVLKALIVCLDVCVPWVDLMDYILDDIKLYLGEWY